MSAVAPGTAEAPVLHATRCPICTTAAFDREVYRMNFRPEDLTAEVFSARRLPDRLHYRMVRCGQCGLLRSDPILPAEQLAALYARSQFTYESEAAFTRRTYGAYLARALPLVRRRGRLMEIGCGNGFFLQEAAAHGFDEVWGVEPSAEAVARAPAALRARIRAGLYDRETFADEQFDLVCGFQVLDHVPDPAALVAACREDLRAGGVALFINHDCGALSARLLGELSPIVDVEHTVLFDRRTMRRLFEESGFRVVDVFSARNTYPLRYWAKLAPLPGAVKGVVLGLLEATRVGRLPLTLHAGNLGLIATKG